MSCPGCSSPIHPTQILCGRCYNEDFVTRWPKCQHCFFHNACPSSGYELCEGCEDKRYALWHTSATKIQRVFRDVLAKYDAATMLQALWRGYRIRMGHPPVEPTCTVCRVQKIEEFGEICLGCYWEANEDWHEECHAQRAAALAKLIH